MKKIAFIISASFILFSCSKKTYPNPSATSLPAANGTPVTVNINQKQPGIVIPETFEGLSYEIGILPKKPTFLNSNNTVLIQLIKNLGKGVIRVGGNSSDKTPWTGKARMSTTTTDSLTTTDIDVFSAFTKATGWQVLFGLNLGVYNTSVAANEAAYVSNDLGASLFAFQNGNEPDLFYKNGIRNSSYSYTNYHTEWTNYFSAVNNVLPRAAFAGPDVANNTQWVNSFAANKNENVVLIDGHYYNSGPASKPSITYQTLLAKNTKLPVYLQSLNISSSKYNRPYRVSECNSVYNGGKSGVSNVFASTLWALDYMWQVAENNGQGINFHGGNSGAYTPIALNNVITARPEYYAMLAFNYAGTGSTIIPATISQTTANCTAYACLKSGTTYITLLNKDSINVSYRINLSNNTANIQVARLSAPSVTATTGITFGGSCVNADGTFKISHTENYTLNKNYFTVNIPAYSAAVISLQ